MSSNPCTYMHHGGETFNNGGLGYMQLYDCTGQSTGVQARTAAT